mmetsp:Transcript_10443/g.33158  ORF Transcript_10443/g.33158 Transcript_10443/m.33158 type:complete len:285 (-) Transcript_10443:159-1013(-)
MLARSMLRSTTFVGASARVASRAMSSDAAKVSLVETETPQVKRLEMGQPPVNALSMDLLTELKDVLRTARKDKECRGLVVASSVPKVFSAGLDLSELYQAPEDRMRAFWTALQDAWIELYSSPLVTVAALEGHAPAGGCMLAMSCDYRIAADTPKLRMGLNETQLGIVAPFWFAEVMRSLVGTRQTERLLQLGHMASMPEALRLGLVDETVAADAVRARAEEVAAEWLQVNGAARYATKMAMRGPLLERLKSSAAEDTEGFVRFVCQAPVQKALGHYLATLGKK